MTEALFPKQRDMELERIYKEIYPRHMGKGQGMKRLRNQIKTYSTLNLLESAANNYRIYVEKNDVEAKYIKYFSSWVSEWKDWIDPENGKTNIKKHKVDLKGIFE